MAENVVYGTLVLVGFTMTAACVGLVVGAWSSKKEGSPQVNSASPSR